MLTQHEYSASSKTEKSKETNASKMSVLLREATPQDLFNLPLYEHHLVIDTRRQEEYDQGHIATSVSLPSPQLDCSEAEREKLLVQFIESYIREFVRPENPSPVVLYGSARPECLKHIDWLAKKLESLQKDRKAVATVQPSEEAESTSELTEERYDPFEQFCHTIADDVREIWILKSGYESFRSEYDFLCGLVPFEEMFPVPHRIDRHLFLGSRHVQLTRDVLSKLNITHLVVSSCQKMDWHEVQGVSVLQCEVADRNNQDMTACWKACVTFITEALEGGHTVNGSSARVLVLLHGRSRSTSVVLAYLIKTLRIEFEEAWTIVCNKCSHLIDRSLVYEDQLREWEALETKALH